MTESCPDCDSVLMTVDEGFVCLGCDREFADNEIEASPLYVTDAFGEVRLDVPDPRRGHSEQQLQFDPDEAERLAQDLLDAAERVRGDDA